MNRRPRANRGQVRGSRRIRNGLGQRAFSFQSLEDRQLLASDISLTEFGANGESFVISYNVAAETTPAFNISVYRSSDGVTRDGILASRAITLQSNLGGGDHTIEIPPDFIDMKGDYRLIAVADSLNQVAETSEDNNELAFAGGVLRTPDGVVHVHGSDAEETITIKDGVAAGSSGSGSVSVKIDDWMIDYEVSTVQEIHVRLHGGDDVLNIQPRVSHDVHAYGGSGDDRILSGAGSDWLVGGAGDDFIAGRAGRDMIDGDRDPNHAGNDTLLGGADADTLVGFAGDDKLVGGSGKDILDGGEGRDIVDGGNDDDIVRGGKGADRLVNPPGSSELRDSATEDTQLAITPEELIFGELSAEDQGSEIVADDSPESFGFSGYAGPFWIESALGNLDYQSEGSEDLFWPYAIDREDNFGYTTTIPIWYYGTATSADFFYRQASVQMGEYIGPALQVYDDGTLENTETVIATMYDGTSAEGIYFTVGYPAGGQSSTNDIDGNPGQETAYIVDGDVKLHDALLNPIPESAEENPGGSLHIGEFLPLELSMLDSPGPSHTITYPSSIAVWLDGNREQALPSGSTITSLYTLLYIEAIAPLTNGVVSFNWEGAPLDRVFVSAVDLDIDSDNTNGYLAPDRSLYEDQIESWTGPNYPGKLVFVNDGDADDDTVPDYADGYDIFGNQGYFASGPFTPVVIQVDPSLPSNATVAFTYDGSHPAALTRSGDATNGYEYIPAPGYARLWTKDSWESRLKLGLHVGGHYITPTISYTLAQLGMDAFGKITLFVEAVRESTVSLQIVAQVDADGTGPAPKVAQDNIRYWPIMVDIGVDTNRNGEINRLDHSEHRWTPGRGAIFNVNFDADAGYTDFGHPGSDAIGFYNNGTIQAHYGPGGKPIIDNAADEADITPFVIYRTGAPVPPGHKLFLKVPELEDIQSIHVYKQIAAGEAAIWGGLGNRAENLRVEPAQPLEIDITPYVSATTDTTFGLEGLFFRNTGTIHSFDGEIDLALEWRNGAHVYRADNVRLKVAPWVMLPNSEPSENVYAEDDPENLPFRRTSEADAGYVGLDHSGQLEEITLTPFVTGNQWFQDHIEIGYTGRPGGPQDHIIFQVPHGRANTWARDHLLGPGVGIYQLALNIGEHDDGGNLELLPPLGQYALGRIVVGQNVSSELWNFLASQEVQSPFIIDTSFLQVGHVDELVGFALQPGDIIVSDTALAYSLMEAIPAADRGKSVFFDKGGAFPLTGAVSVDATAGTRIYTGIDHTSGPRWGYLRIYDDSESGSGAAGQVAKIAEGGWHDGYLEIETVWNTSSKIIDGGVNLTASQAKYWDEAAPSKSASAGSVWFSLPKAGDKFVLVEDTQFWKSAVTGLITSPAVITVHEILNDDHLRDLHEQYIQPRIDLNKAALEVAAGVSLNFISVPSLMVGKIVDGDVQDARAYAPGLTNFQLVGANYYFPRQFGPHNLTGDIFQRNVSDRIETAKFVDDWDLYHRLLGEVHCGSIVKRAIWNRHSWDWRPPQ